nr:2-amino-4-hydroxy-6-hydroxymethyldihydropteridine diphosphokinase [Bacillus cereus group sp. N31]
MMRSSAFISLGSNIGDREFYLKKGIEKLGKNPNIRILTESSIYETEPIGYINQSTFLNMVIKIETMLSPLDLLNLTQKIEIELKRKREIRWGPRTLDIDILTYNYEKFETDRLTIPHPRMFERSFVLVPLSEIEETLVISNEKFHILELINELPEKKVKKRAEHNFQ